MPLPSLSIIPNKQANVFLCSFFCGNRTHYNLTCQHREAIDTWNRDLRLSRKNAQGKNSITRKIWVHTYARKYMPKHQLTIPELHNDKPSNDGISNFLKWKMEEP